MTQINSNLRCHLANGPSVQMFGQEFISSVPDELACCGNGLFQLIGHVIETDPFPDLPKSPREQRIIEIIGKKPFFQKCGNEPVEDGRRMPGRQVDCQFHDLRIHQLEGFVILIDFAGIPLHQAGIEQEFECQMGEKPAAKSILCPKGLPKIECELSLHFLKGGYAVEPVVIAVVLLNP